MSDSKKWQRMTLNKAQRATAIGTELIRLLGGFLKDGMLQPADIEQLRAWLKEAKAANGDLPCVTVLREIVERALADGQVTDDERREIVKIMLRILPAEDRDKIQPQVSAVETAELEAAREELTKAKEEAEKARIAEGVARKLLQAEEAQRRREERANQPPRWHFDPATEPQLRYLRALGASFDEQKITKGEASELIDAILNSPDGISNRQMMILRFWDKVDLADHGKNFVSEWMDRWYAEDPDHIAAWEWWKESNGDWGCKDADPALVTIGCGTRWLRMVKLRRGQV